MTLLLGFAAVNTGNNLLYLVVSALLGFMAVTGWCGHSNLTHLELQLLPSHDFFAATPGSVRVKITNQRRLPTYLLNVRIDKIGVVVPALAAGENEVVQLPLMMPRRGFCPVPVVHLSSCFPVNFFVRSWRIDSQQSLLVYPRPLATSMPLQETPFSAPAEQQTVMPGGEGDLRSIEDYRAGDPPKSIHWKLSARHQELKTKQMNRQAEEVRILDPERLDGTLEERLSRCTYLINRCFNDNHAVGLMLAGRYIAPRSGRKQRLRLLKELALYE